MQMILAGSSRVSRRPLSVITRSSARLGPHSVMALGKTMTSMAASRSSSTKMAMSSPLRVYLRARWVTTPATVHTSPVSGASRSSRMEQSVRRRSRCSIPIRGWSLT